MQIVNTIFTKEKHKQNAKMLKEYAKGKETKRTRKFVTTILKNE